jgi:hypothetical protein
VKVWSKFIALTSIVCFILFFAIFSNKTYAHTVSYNGSESEGWVHGTHATSKTQKFFFVFGTDQFWRDRFNNGASYTSSQTGNQLKMVNDSAINTNNYVEAQNVSSATWVARTVYNTSGQHKTTWWIQFNSAYKNDYSSSQWDRIAQHEITHVFGLKDLYKSYNSHRLMWWIAGNYTGLTTEEKNGLKYIWGY